jgi:hypothetical protein
MHPIEYYVSPLTENLVTHYVRRRLIRTYVQEVTETWVGNHLIASAITDRTHDLEVIEHFAAGRDANRSSTVVARITIGETQQTLLC